MEIKNKITIRKNRLFLSLRICIEHRARLHFQLITIIMTFQEPSVYFSIFRKEFWESSLLKKAVSLDIPWYRRDTLDSPILF